jgi:hypothetical protein
MKDVVARYLDCWNETDPAARRKLIEDGGDSLVEGSDVAVTDADNKITTVPGFLDKVPA